MAPGTWANCSGSDSLPSSVRPSLPPGKGSHVPGVDSCAWCWTSARPSLVVRLGAQPCTPSSVTPVYLSRPRLVAAAWGRAVCGRSDRELPRRAPCSGAGVCPGGLAPGPDHGCRVSGCSRVSPLLQLLFVGNWPPCNTMSIKTVDHINSTGNSPVSVPGEM